MPINTLSLGTVDVDGGDLLLSRDTAYQLTQTISANTNEVVLWAANLNVGQAISLEDVDVAFSSTGNGLQTISSLRLVVGNQTLATYTPASGENAFVFETTFTLTQNTPIKILANFRNTANGTFTIGSVDLGSLDLRYVSNDEEANIAGTVNGIQTLVDVATLTAIRNDGIDNGTLVPGANNVLLLGFDLRASDVSDIRVTSIQPAKAGTVATSNITNVRLYQGETLLSTRNDFNFGTINVTIPQNSSKRFTVVADFNTAVASGQTLNLSVASANVAARNVQSNALINLNNTINSQAFTFAAAGSVEVNENSSQANRSIVSPSTTEVSVFKFDIEAKDDVMRLTDVYIEQTQTTGVDLASALRSASLTIGSTTINAVVLNSDTLHFPFGSQGLVLDKDDVVTADLKVAFFDSNTRTNREITFELPTGPVAGQVNGTQNGMRIISDSTGLEVNRGTASIASRDHLLARSNPTVARQSEVSSQVAYKFTVTANANRKIILDQMHFEVEGLTGLANFTLRRDGVNTPMQVITAHDLQSSGNVIFDTLAQDFEVSAGGTVTYVVEISGLNTALNSGRTREVKFANMIYVDDVTTGFEQDIVVAPYNVLPTSISSHFYPN